MSLGGAIFLVVVVCVLLWLVGYVILWHTK